jgi:hypothetical protein
MIQIGRKCCTVFSQFGVVMKLVRLTKMCLNEKYSKVNIGKCSFLSKIVYNREMLCHHCFSTLL